MLFSNGDVCGNSPVRVQAILNGVGPRISGTSSRPITAAHTGASSHALPLLSLRRRCGSAEWTSLMISIDWIVILVHLSKVGMKGLTGVLVSNTGSEVRGRESMWAVHGAISAFGNLIVVSTRTRTPTNVHSHQRDHKKTHTHSNTLLQDCNWIGTHSHTHKQTI